MDMDIYTYIHVHVYVYLAPEERALETWNEAHSHVAALNRFFRAATLRVPPIWI